MKHYTLVDYVTQGYSAVVALLILFFHNGTVQHWTWLLAAHAAGLTLIHWLIQWYASGRAGRVLDFLRHFYPVLIYTSFFCETGSLNRMFLSTYLDPTVIQWDQWLFGTQPSVIFMQKLPYLAVSELFYAAYFSYYLMIPGIGLALFIRNRQQFFHYLSVVSFLFYVCYMIYIFVPVIGPRVFFYPFDGFTLPAEIQLLAPTNVYPESVRSGFWFTIMIWIYRVFEAPGAALPSSHVAVAWCTVFFSFRYLRPIRYVHLGVVILLCLSTLYCRYHYAIDVVAGLLTAAILVPLGNRLYFKYAGRELQSRPRVPASADLASVRQ